MSKYLKIGDRGLPILSKAFFTAAIGFMGYGAFMFIKQNQDKQLLTGMAVPFLIAGFYYGSAGAIAVVTDILSPSKTKMLPAA